MPQITIKFIPDDLDKRIRIFMIQEDFSRKDEAIVEALERFFK